MIAYEELLFEADDEGIEVLEFIFESDIKGLYSDYCIAISHKLDTTTEKKCVLAEELGHYHTSDGNLIDLKSIQNRKQEVRARKWSYEKLIPLKSIIKASFGCCANLYELAEYLDVTEQFLKEALTYYQSKYGLYAEVDNYCIYFNPFTVCKYNYK